MNGKRIQKFTEHPDQFKKTFNKVTYPMKDNGVRLINEITEGKGFSTSAD